MNCTSLGSSSAYRAAVANTPSSAEWNNSMIAVAPPMAASTYFVRRLTTRFLAPERWKSSLVAEGALISRAGIGPSGYATNGKKVAESREKSNAEDVGAEAT